MQIIRDPALILFQAQRIKGIKQIRGGPELPQPPGNLPAAQRNLPTLLFISYIRAVKAVLPAQVTALNNSSS